MKNRKWICFSFNPWKKLRPDCAIRAISAATMLDYREVCKQLGVAYKNGMGLIRDSGIDLEMIKSKFNDYFDIVEDFAENYSFVPDEFQGSDEDWNMDKFDAFNGLLTPTGLTLNEWLDLYDGQGDFLVGLQGNKDAENPVARDGGHIVCAWCRRGKPPRFIDTWDSGEMLVDSFMRLKKKEPASSPRRLKFDKEKNEIVL